VLNVRCRSRLHTLKTSSQPPLRIMTQKGHSYALSLSVPGCDGSRDFSCSFSLAEAFSDTIPGASFAAGGVDTMAVVGGCAGYNTREYADEK
jgi:hypothetical protein